jgi:hypothetical protein
VFLGRLHERDDLQQVAGKVSASFSALAPPGDPAWGQAAGLLRLAEQGRRFTPGTVLDGP